MEEKTTILTGERRGREFSNIENLSKNGYNLATHIIYTDDDSTRRHETQQSENRIFWFSVLVLLVIVALDILDITSNWLFYGYVVGIDGVACESTWKSMAFYLLAFSILGSTMAVFEIVNLWRELFRSDPWVDTTLSAGATVWTQDVLQLIISLLIASCGNQSVGFSQPLKAVIVIVNLNGRSYVSFIRYRTRSTLATLLGVYQKRFLYRSFVTVTFVISLSCAIAVLVLSKW